MESMRNVFFFVVLAVFSFILLFSWRPLGLVPEWAPVVAIIVTALFGVFAARKKKYMDGPH